MLKTLVIDNYDSFVYNLVQYIGELGGNPVVYRNDKITLEKIIEEKPTHIVISPGPGDPTDPKYFGVCNDVILKLGKEIPVLGVCLGHQGIGACFGATIIRSPATMHGKTSKVFIEKDSILFKGVKNPFEVMRYHSLAVKWEKVPEDIIITSKTQDNTIMSFEHKKFPIYAVQFHPESIGTPEGKKIIKNFLCIKCN